MQVALFLAADVLGDLGHALYHVAAHRVPHQDATCNFGENYVVWDRLMGTLGTGTGPQPGAELTDDEYGEL